MFDAAFILVLFSPIVMSFFLILLLAKVPLLMLTKIVKRALSSYVDLISEINKKQVRLDSELAI